MGTMINGCSSSGGGTLVVGLDGDMVYADPALVSDGNSLYVAAQVVEGLVGLKPGTIGDVIPVLASSLPTVSSDGKTYTFTLRTGVKFQDGTDFNAAAVKYNYDRWKAFPKGDLQDNAYYYGAVFGGFGSSSNVVSVDAPNDTTVVFNLKTPQSNFLLSQTLQVFGIESPTALQKGNADTTPIKNNKYAQGQLSSDMVGTGPFEFKSWTPGSQIILVKNNSYWDSANAAKLDQAPGAPVRRYRPRRDDRACRCQVSPELRAHHHQPRPVLQPRLPGPESERGRHVHHLGQQGRPLCGRLCPQQAELHQCFLWRPGPGADQLAAARHNRLQG
jgi:ABC-type transport system substrate-binding protein